MSRTFGCVRKVYNLALAARSGAWQERVTYNQTSTMLTGWKKTEELAFLGEVSSVPFQQTLRHLQTAFTQFFAKRAKDPRFKSRKESQKSAEYTRSGFRFRDGRLTLAKMAEPLDIVWSRPLPEGAQLAAGLAASVCGAGVRPQRSSPGGQSATKQKNPTARAVGLPLDHEGEEVNRGSSLARRSRVSRRR
ncbi:hypothetical protein M2283_001723 [Streptomyces pseudovenezuelae]|uniref:Transposase putative helix-turn-helix domain-containing protein n=1 Tax=Streptomyces pseudovenezuelae TaxID=67350 RepID=A0ABT6LDP7_9ACTN|nr:hypothetical protein [Streptomyces pseudovenezuelae]